MATPSFEVQSVTDSSLNIRIYIEAPYTAYRVLVRKASSATAIVYDKWFEGISGGRSFDAYVSGLDAGTDYVINVAYNTVADAATSKWIGAQTETTDPSGGGGGGGGGTTTYSVTLRFNANGGTGAPSSITETGNGEYVDITIPRDEPTRTGYFFEGWADDDAATKAQYYPGRTYSWYATEAGYTHRLYAVWTKEQTGSVRIGPNFELYTPYIWTSSGWQRATAHIWDNGWKRGS